MKEKLLNVLKDMYEIDEKNIIKQNWSIDNLTLYKLRDNLMIIGQIVFEDMENQIYVAEINVGVASFGKALVAVCLDEGDLYMLSYAEEGIIKQHLAERALAKLETQLKDYVINVNSVVTKKHKGKIIFFSVIIFLFIGILLWGVVNRVKIASYNQAVTGFNEVAEEYNTYSAKTAIYNISGMPLELDKKEYLNDNVFGYLVATIKDGYPIDLQKNVEQINSEKEVLQSKIKMMEQITNPDEEWIIEKLGALNNIVEIQAVTKENDPTGLLGKDGGTTTCVYFSISEIDQNSVSGRNVVEKGTDCGGCVEVYGDLISAEERCDYLQQFDGTLLYSGSYAVVGTMVIRTSYQLSSTQQLELTDTITHEFTKMVNE